MKVQKTIEVWLVKKRIPRPIDLVQYDTGIRLVFSLMDFKIPTNTTATLYVQKPSGKFVYQEKGIVVSDSTITIDLENQALAEHGDGVQYQVHLKNGTNLITTFAGIFRIEKSLADSGAVESKTVISAFEEKTAEQIELIHKASLEQQEIIKSFHDATKGSAIVCESLGEVISVADASDDPVRGLSIYGKTIQNGTPTPESPVPLESVGESGNIGVQVGNSNLLPFPYHNKDAETSNGLTFHVQPDGGVVVNGTSTAEAFFSFTTTASKKLFLPKGKYTFSGVPSGTYGGSMRPQLWVQNASGTVKFAVYAEGKTVEITNPDYFAVSIDIVKGNTLNNFVVKPMINVGETALPFESPIERHVLTAQTPNGLCGIPVSSDGNYTDENGQAWICDEIDFARGVYVQRVTPDNIENIAYCFPVNFSTTATRIQFNYINSPNRTGGISTHFRYSTDAVYHKDVSFFYTQNIIVFFVDKSMLEPYGSVADADSCRAAFIAWWKAQENAGTPVEIIMGLKTPIETPLSAEELAAYAALHTNKPNTIAFNDSGAHMALEYNADSKTYIDNKFAELAAAIVNNA